MTNDLPLHIYTVLPRDCVAAETRAADRGHYVENFRHATPQTAWAFKVEYYATSFGRTLDPADYIIVRANLVSQAVPETRPRWVLDWSETHDPQSF